MTTRIKQRRSLEKITVRIAGDSGDGIQLVGNELSSVSVWLGNDIKVLPDFPAEIRAPAGTRAGVSAYQVNIGSTPVYTSGDEADVLVAMNPAALKTNLTYLKKNSIIIINEATFNARGYKLADVPADFLTDNSITQYELFKVPITELTLKALAESSISYRMKERTKNLFALGLVLWLYDRGLAHSEAFIERKFAAEKWAAIRHANLLALRAGYAYGTASELFRSQYTIAPLDKKRSHTRNVTGNDMIAEGLLVGAYRAGVRPFYASYPITPASTILHKLAALKDQGMIVFQAEDEMGAMTAALGASYGGSLGMTGTSGPGFTLKMEALGLAVMAELPVVVIDVQRSGPATGMPTKGEQADLLLALYGRHGEAPLVVTAAASPGDCFYRAVEACVWAIKYRIPVIVLSDANIANGSEPWAIADIKALPETDPMFASRLAETAFSPYARNAALPVQRAWAIPGMRGFEHRIGGLEKDAHTGDVSYDGPNHHHMTLLRQNKVLALQQEIMPLNVAGNKKSPLLVITWGGTYGVIWHILVEMTRRLGLPANEEKSKPLPPVNATLPYDQTGFAAIHLKYLSPFPPNFEEVITHYPIILVIEKNLGQLTALVKARTTAAVHGYHKVQGIPFKITEVREAICACYERHVRRSKKYGVYNK
ncbi:2-oxoglutarate oxidoreductase subunit KorA [Spirochaetota bacterium]|nr:2-oxoglutarate oxidoreductase subunit KorA [Spirochaetota bacterium]